MPNATPSLDTIFCEAVEIRDAAARGAYLERACGPDDALRRRIEALIAAHLKAGSFLDQPPAPVDSTSAFTPSPGDAPTADGHPVHPGTAIGPYHLRELIGEGGMGLVFVAEQTHPVWRKVALKLIKPGMDSRQVIARFEAERQALALMDHPNIARVLDAGTSSGVGNRETGVRKDGSVLTPDSRPLTPDVGRPFFVMELVRGEPITDFCDAHKLTLRQRLELFLQVCAAVQHAHQKGVIHRDLKPSNVLVAVHDVAPVAKVIDFGIAKAVGQSLTDKTVYTAFAQLIGTPLYMSPEQAGQSSLDVDTRTDIYSLGVLLYELLTGTTPFDADTLQKAGFDEMRRIIREDEPAPPSARISTLAAGPRSTVADRRQADPRRLAREVRGELDWVVMKCLEKDRNRRYESVNALTADVQRYLADEPVQACPPSVGYRLRKFARRNKAAVVTTVLVAAAVALGTAASVWKYVDERAARRDADDQRARADENYRRARAAVKQMLTRVATDEVGAIPEMRETRRRLLEDAAAFYTELLRLEPRDTDAYAERAAVCNILGRYDGAVADYQKALNLDPGNAGLHHKLGAVLSRRHDYVHRDLPRALDHTKRAVEIDPENHHYRWELVSIYVKLKLLKDARAELEAFAARAPAGTADTAGQLAHGYWLLGDYPAALPHARRYVELAPGESNAHFRLGEVFTSLGEDDMALAELDEAVRLIARPHDADNQYLFRTRGDLYMRRNRHADALVDYTRAVEVSPDFSFTYKRRAEAYFHLGDYPKALADIARAVELNPDESTNVTWIDPALVAACPDAGFRQGVIDQAGRAITLTNGSPEAYTARAELYAAMKENTKAADDFAQAVAAGRRRLAGLEGKPGRDDALREFAGVQALLGQALVRQGRHAEAEPVLRECLAIRSEKAPDAWNTFNAQSMLGGALLGQKKYAEAEQLLLAGYEGMKQQEPQIPPNGKVRLPEAIERLVELYEATNRPDEAAKWRAMLPPAPKKE